MRLDRTMAVFSSCAALVTPPDAVDRNKRADALWLLMAKTLGSPQGKGAVDLCVPAGSALAKANPALHRGAASSSVLTQLYPAFAAAGIQ
jgi:hypothetical protein